MPDLELDDVQGLIARGYGELKAASYVLLRVVDPGSARGWLASLVGDRQVTPANVRGSPTALNVAFSAPGLAALGLPADALAAFPSELRTGMTTAHRRRMLGDVDESAPERWLWGGPSTPTVDLLLLVFAQDAASLAEYSGSLSAGFARGGVAEIARLDATIDLDGKEHFGFADGISQPTVRGLSSRVDRPSNTVQPGEFILGYLNEYGRYTERPLLEPGADPGNLLPLDAAGSGKRDLARNGSYLVFRHLAQDVRGFWQFVERATRRADGSSDPARRTWLAAKMVGRWPSGAPLTLSPDVDDASLAGRNDFAYHRDDAFGLRCPIASHVRRAHPRDSLDPAPGTDRSVAVNKRHRLLRRGREYGLPVDDPLAAEPREAEEERGLYFIALAGNIARQFEFVHHTWLNSPTFDGLYDEPDPVVGPRVGGTTFSVPADPVRLRYTGLPRFVTVRGGGYFFLPGLRALRYLTSRES